MCLKYLGPRFITQNFIMVKSVCMEGQILSPGIIWFAFIVGILCSLLYVVIIYKTKNTNRQTLIIHTIVLLVVANLGYGWYLVSGQAYQH
jgi:uncharacterized membrane protein YqjE